MTTAAQLATDELAERCADETGKFTRHEDNDPQFCFELLSRALLNDLSEAFTHIYRIYEPMVRRWIYNYSRFIQSGEDVEYFANAAMSKFYFALRGEKFERFDSLEKVLLYLKRCIHTEIAQHIRGQRAIIVPLLDEDRTPAPKAEPDFSAQELWVLINRLLADEKDRMLARCLFIEDMKPAQVFATHPDQWDSPREVSVARQRITRILRRDEGLCRWAGIDASED
jgi:DNA-directed RNA polymerase specialized sigma24 family protein